MSARADIDANQERQLNAGTNSHRYRPRTLLDFDSDDFNWQTAPTSGSLALKFAPKSAQTAMPPQALLGLVPKVKSRTNDWRDIVADYTPTPADAACFGGVAALIKAAPPERTLTSIQYSMTARTVDDHEAYLRGCEQRALANRKQKAAIAVAA